MCFLVLSQGIQHTLKHKSIEEALLQTSSRAVIIINMSKYVYNDKSKRYQFQ